MASFDDKGVARRAELEKALGPPTSGETSVKAIYADDVAKIELEVKEKAADGSFTIHETYRPKTSATTPRIARCPARCRRRSRTRRSAAARRGARRGAGS